MPSKPADRTDDARSDETFGLTETKGGSKCFVINVNRRQKGQCIRNRVFEKKNRNGSSITRVLSVEINLADQKEDFCSLQGIFLTTARSCYAGSIVSP